MYREPRLCDCKAVLFDVDGTLVDSMAKIVMGLGDAIEHFAGKRPPDKEIQSLVGLPLSAQFKRYLPFEPSREQMDEMITYTIGRYDHHKHLERPFEPAIETLRLCQQAGLKTALVTSKNTAEMEIFLRGFVGKPYVDAYVCASDVPQPKPKPDSAIRACELLQVEPGDACFVGDSIFDMQCAHAAGNTPVAVAYGSVPAATLEKENPALILETPEALLEWAQRTLFQTTCPDKPKN